MTRSGYSYDYEHINLYRNTVALAIKGRRGQSFLRELASAMDAMPRKELIAHELQDQEGDVCAIGSVLRERGVEMERIDYEDPEDVGKAAGIARCLAAEIEYINDECGRIQESPAERWVRVRKWVAKQIGETWEKDQ